MSDPLAAATRTLVRRFRAQRPLRGGSLIITIFGDAIAPRGGAVTLGGLIRLARPFGLTERLVRTSVARLAQEGWLESRRNGRLSEYRLAPGGRERFAEATRRIYGPNPARWDGQWTLLLLPPDAPAARRDRLRRELLWLGFGQLSPGVLIHPSRTPAETRGLLSQLGAIARDVTVLSASSGDPSEDSRLAHGGWDLADLGRRYRRFVDGFLPVRDALAASQNDPPCETAFVIRTLLVHEYRKIHLRDPLLPAGLLPANWIGNTAYELCRDLYGRLFHAAEAHLTAEAQTLEGPPPPASSEALSRFGGIPEAMRGSGHVTTSSRAARRTPA